MITCYPSGALRAYLDGELPADDSAVLKQHLETCAACRTELDELAALHERVGRALVASTAASASVEAAWSQVQARLGATPSSASAHSRRAHRALVAGPRRRLALGAATAAALMLAALLVPSVRAAASQALQIFRAQSVVYISVSPSRVQQLEQLRGDQNALFLSQPTEVGTPAQVQQVSSLQSGQALAGFAPQAPATLPAGIQSSSIEVRGQSTYQMRVNVHTVRQILQALGVTDVNVPDALGAQPLTVVLPPLVRLHYVGQNYTMNLIEGTSPTVNLPAGVDLSQLGKAALEVYGMSPQQADTMSKHIDWGSTLVFPFPIDTSRVQQVDISGATGMLLDAQVNGTWEGVVYWQRGSHFYVLIGQGDGLGNAALLVAANSLH